MKKNIAVTSGGTSHEYIISMKSATTIMESIDRSRFTPYQVVISKDGWFAHAHGQQYTINKDNFSFTLEGQEITFDFVYNTIHGTPGEDGKIQGYLDLLGIPYSGCDVITSSITFNKNLCKRIAASYGFTTPQSVMLNTQMSYDVKQLVEELSFPCFVKPNNGGSSFGASKVDEPGQLEAAINLAFEHDKEVLIEEYIKGTEMTCGVFLQDGKARALPITEIVSKNAFFDYKAKYEGASEEITPARISAEQTAECQGLSERIYTLLNCKGLVRIDYLMKEGVFYFIEANTTPGFSRASIIPQQIRAAGLDISQIVNQQIRL
ncbi:D-alanine--D-alanine ligase [Catalinimonas niigatensis]|uniref:D-alanine--D-alanine ligase n=1 Tax=Catalinimonas niigatensis TaxID=1397264 RepID=UPI00266659AB|nr:D-alanine--D-alanine ligase [Catalinimonas niigatensis]WPP51407.1 D-alanine--D-alanine ligase [Catalinimonas niigatensis]